jgi:macrolide transport system ATP-binding/permease protein
VSIIKLEDIHKTYHRGPIAVPVLKGISLTIEPGEMVAIMGVSGSGKTTLLNLLGCLDRPTGGKYWLNGQEVSRLSNLEQAQVRNRTLGFVFQNFNLLPRSTALENVMMPLAYANPPVPDGEGRKRAETLLQRVGLGERMDHAPSRLSGGQMQRVAIARSLVNQPALVFADEPTGNLDSATSVEILRMFQQLNAEYGLTIIIVTHDKWVANHAKRIIHIKDGLIESDKPSEGFLLQADQQAMPARRAPLLGASRRRRLPLPSLNIGGVVRPVRMAMQALRRNILRSVLTTLGIIIGIAALIAIVEIGKGSSAAIKEVLTNMGASNLVVQSGKAVNNGVSLGTGSVKTLTPEDAEAIQNECTLVSGVAPVVRARSQVIYGNRNWVPFYIYGTTPGFLEVRDWTDLESGECFTTDDVKNSSLKCLLGQTVVQELFGTVSPVGKEVYIQNVPLKVIGVLSRKGVNLMGLDQDDILIAPWTTIRNRVSGASLTNSASTGTATTSSTDPNAGPKTLNQRYPNMGTDYYPSRSAMQDADRPTAVRYSNVDVILVRTEQPEEIPAAIEQIKEILHERHHLSADDEDDFYVRDLTEIIKALDSTVKLVTTLLVSVAMICLIVGGVGIMNIMLVSVTERTREIGLRMAVGASGPAILRQFLVEAVVLCLLGGVLGIMVGRGASWVANSVLHWRTEASLMAVVASVAVSVTVGLIFGYYPAWKASKLDPIEALRYE